MLQSMFVLWLVTTTAAIGLTFVAINSTSPVNVAWWFYLVVWLPTVLLGWWIIVFNQKVNRRRKRRLEELGKFDSIRMLSNPEELARWSAQVSAIELDDGTRPELTDEEVNAVAEQWFYPRHLETYRQNRHLPLDDNPKK